MKRDRPHEEKEEDGDREKKRLIITIPKKAFEGQQIKRLRVDQEKKILQYFENMRQNDRKREDDDIILVGPVSCYYFEDLTLFDGTKRNIVLLGDHHGSFEIANDCCTKTHIVENRYKQILDIIFSIKDADKK